MALGGMLEYLELCPAASVWTLGSFPACSSCVSHVMAGAEEFQRASDKAWHVTVLQSQVHLTPQFQLRTS